MQLNRTLDRRQEAIEAAEKAIDKRLDPLIERMDRLGVPYPRPAGRFH